MQDSALSSEKTMLRRKMMGVKIRYARTRVGLELSQISALLGAADDVVAEIEMGQREVSLPQLEVIALACNVPVGFFWSEAPLPEPHLDFPSQAAMALRRRIIGALLRQARAEAGHSQDDLAQLINTPTAKINDYELGQTEIPLYQLEVLAEYLNVSIDYFIDRGIAPAHQNGYTPSLDELAQYAQLPPEVREFLSNPANRLYLNIAMKLSSLSAETLRALAEGLLEVTY